MSVPKKIPTLLALFILFFAIGGISLFVQRITSSSRSTSPSLEPKNLMITSVSDTSGKIIWQTADKTTGQVILTSKSGTKITTSDERDASGKTGSYVNHSVLVKNLQPNTTYTMTVLSNGKPYTPKNTPLTLQTGPTIMSSNAAGFEPAYGMAKTADGKPASGGLVVLTLENSQPISTLITASGSWIIPLNVIRTADLSRYVPAQELLKETITIYYGEEKTEGITDTANDAPVPDMTIGESYDFRNQQSKAKGKTGLADAGSSSKESVLGETTIAPSGVQKLSTVAITAPAPNASLVSNRPLIQGKGIPGKTVSVTLGIKKPMSGKTTVGSNGLWSFTPASALTSGKQSVTITTTDEKGKAVALTNVFTILKSGTQVLGDATPSATLEPTMTATATPTLEASITAQPLPEPGGELPTILLILTAIGFVAGGFVLFR